MEELKGGMQDAHKVHFPQRRNLKDWQQIILLLILQPSAMNLHSNTLSLENARWAYPLAHREEILEV
jgi:hypothetical protein